jgi:rhamnosyltransferase
MLADLVPRLVQKGYGVRCSCEKPASGKHIADDTGATLDYFALKPPANYTVRKAFELLYDSYFIARYSLICDVIYVLGIYGGPSLLIPRLLKRQVVVNMDGLEWKRAKYTVVERSIIILLFAVSLNLASKIVVDNEQLKRCIGERHCAKTCYIPYGVSEQKPQSWDGTKLRSYFRGKTASGTIAKGNYWLLIARLEPENNIHMIVDGFVKARPNYPLVIVGDFTSDKYRHRVYRGVSNGKSANIFFLGAIYDADVLGMLRQHCLAYIHGHSVGGTNPSLLEAMISKNLIVCHDNVFNREVCSRFAYYFSNSIGLSDLVTLIEKNGRGSAEFRSEVYKRAIAAYSWDHIVTSYDKLFRGDDSEVA